MGFIPLMCIAHVPLLVDSIRHLQEINACLHTLAFCGKHINMVHNKSEINFVMFLKKLKM